MVAKGDVVILTVSGRLNQRRATVLSVQPCLTADGSDCRMGKPAVSVEVHRSFKRVWVALHGLTTVAAT